MVGFSEFEALHWSGSSHIRFRKSWDRTKVTGICVFKFFHFVQKEFAETQDKNYSYIKAWKKIGR